MLLPDLLALIRHGENSFVEFKRDDVRPEQVAKELVAFLNHEGGRLLLGVEDDGALTGLTCDDAERWVMDTVFGRYIHPLVVPSYEEVRLDGDRRVGVVSVPRGLHKPYVLAHQGREDVYIRMGSTAQRATREQQARLFAASGLLHPEVLPVPGSRWADLSRPRLENYLRDVLQEPQLPPDEAAWIERLLGLGLMTQEGGAQPVCTIAGVVLFGLAPRRLLRHAGVRWMAFDTPDLTYQALDDAVLEGPLVALWQGNPASTILLEPGLVERFLERTRPFLSVEAADVEGTFRRQRVWRYPPEAVRETVLNALAHRDWTRSQEIEVVRYRDRLDVTSPGALQNAMTVEKMRAGQRSARNPLVVDVLRDYGYVEARGMGVRRKIVPLIREATGHDPVFEATEDYLRVQLPQDRRFAASR